MVTIVSIIAVGLAGATAVGANIGILDSASDSPVGDASVTGDLGTPSTQVVDVYLSDTAGKVQRFAVDAAGTVALIAADSVLRLDDVVPTAGWNWTLMQSSESSLRVTFTDGNRTLEFTATAATDGTISTFVSEPVGGPASVLDGDDDDFEEYEGLYDDD